MTTSKLKQLVLPLCREWWMERSAFTRYIILSGTVSFALTATCDGPKLGGVGSPRLWYKRPLDLAVINGLMAPVMIPFWTIVGGLFLIGESGKRNLDYMEWRMRQDRSEGEED